MSAETKRIDAEIVIPKGDGTVELDGLTRDLELLLEAEVRALVRLEQRHADGRRAAYARTISRLRSLRTLLGDVDA